MIRMWSSFPPRPEQLNLINCCVCGLFRRRTASVACETCCKRYCDNTICGSRKINKCANCYLNQENEDLMMAIYENTPFGDDITIVLCEYASGYVFECGNYAQCQQTICLASWLESEQGSFYKYEVPEQQVEKYGQYLTKVGTKYWRTLCKQCVDGKQLKKCEICWSNKDVGFVTLSWPRYICFKHTNEVIAEIPKCDNCSISYPTTDWFKNGLKKCKLCKKMLCVNCGDGHVFGGHVKIGNFVCVKNDWVCAKNAPRRRKRRRNVNGIQSDGVVTSE